MATTTKFAPNSFFFTDPAAITQSADQAFGPVSAEEFRLTSKFSLSAAAKAYAICTGVVFIQPQAGNDGKVNLILRPYKQPALGLNIKYFIYRGLNKADFFDGDNVIAVTGDTSDFINSINTAFAAFYNSTDPGGDVPDFLAKYIGFDPANQPDNLPISNFFFKQSEYTTSGTTSTETDATAFDLPMVTAGASLGNFVTGECGIDVVLNYGDYALPTPNDEFVFDLAYARTDEYSIDTTDVTSDFQVKLLREQIVQFIDAAAYYGFHYCDDGVVMLNSAGTKTSKTGDAIYTDVLQNFYTKNKIYLYIQSDRTRSYNFYGNYLIDEAGTNSLKLGPTEDMLTAIDFNTNSWPLLIDDSPQNHSDARNMLYLQLVTDNNDNTMLYGQVAQIDNAEANNFCGPDDLRLPADEDGNPSIYTKVLALSNPASGPDGAKVNVANFNILIYQGETYDYVAGQTTDDDGNTVNIIAEPDFFDDVFDILNATPLLKAGDTTYSTVASQKVKLINHFYDNTQFGVSAVQTSIVNDQIDTGDDTNPTLDRVIYISQSVDILNNVVSVSGTVTADTKANPSVAGAVTGSKTYQLPSPFSYSLTTFTDNGDSINGLILTVTDNSIPDKIILGLTKDENDGLKSLIASNSFVNPRLFLVDLFDDSNQLISTENILYQKYKAGIVGETATGELELALSDDDIIVYSLDRKYHFSKGFSDYVKVDNSVTSLVLDLNVSL